MKTIVLFGASSAIANAYIEHLQINTPTHQIVCISSKSIESDSSVVHLHTDYTKQSLARVTNYLKEQNADIQQVIIFNGTLHNETHMPEKKLEDLDAEYFSQLLNSNTLTPLLCLQSILPLLTHKTHCTITALSARVGSINDNKLGGWYTYRASKAALNMLSKKTKLVLFLPGTTDAALSKPFQKIVPAGTLFTAEFVAKQLFTLTFNNPHLELNGEPAYLDWQGETIPW
mgnify:CR=1 FL=1